VLNLQITYSPPRLYLRFKRRENFLPCKLAMLLLPCYVMPKNRSGQDGLVPTLGSGLVAITTPCRNCLHLLQGKGAYCGMGKTKKKTQRNTWNLQILRSSFASFVSSVPLWEIFCDNIISWKSESAAPALRSSWRSPEKESRSWTKPWSPLCRRYPAA